ncbi:MAG: glycosyl hydrolase 43 family protein [Flaviaesturariibacter sp.]|nr:glycosyl hydrolase 43 family protein [Flaviaesturariibacter sp.]
MKRNRSYRCSLLLLLLPLCASAQTPYVSKVWVADQGNGSYKNPVLNADYSDPDVIRVGADFYLVSSSFEDMPGLPILHSKDLVNWTIIGHALPRQVPLAHFSVPRHGDGVWAPSLRYHNGRFYLYYPDPDFGIYLLTATNAAGPWSEPVLVEAGKGLIDPCPLWDDDGRAYLVHGFAGSRAGIKSVIAVKRLSVDGTSVLDAGTLVYDGHDTDPTIEGPKFYKRNGYYYIFAPAGGVPTGWQLVLRSKHVYGPYERKVVMDQGSSPVNGPHQGAWVTTQTGEDWFLHFQDKEAYGRVVHLQPMKWIKDWPVIGVDADGDGKGEPVLTYRKPNVGLIWPVETPVESDEFNGPTLGMQWQWMSNPKATWLYPYPAKGVLRLYSEPTDSARNLWETGSVLLQKFPADQFSATTKLHFAPNPKLEGERCGLVIMGLSYAGIGLKQTKTGIQLVSFAAADAGKGRPETETVLLQQAGPDVVLRVHVAAGGVCTFSYSVDGRSFTPVEGVFRAEVGKWKGAKMGLFCSRNTTTNDSGWADIDWFRVD